MSARVAMFMAGGNIHARFILAATSPGLIINETGTPRAETLSKFLDNDLKGFNPPPLRDLIAPSSKYVEVNKFDGQESISLLQDFRPDYIVSGGAGIVKEPLLTLAPVLNTHPGLLPDYRGCAPVLWSIRNRDPLGATLHIMDEGIDTGPILIRRKLPRGRADSVLMLRLRCMKLCGEIVGEFLSAPATYPPEPQDITAGATYPDFFGGNMIEAEHRLKSALSFYRS